MDMHRKFGEIFFSTMTNTAIALSKLRASLTNVQSQLKLEKISSLGKDTKVKTLEYLVIKLGCNPSDVKSVEDILKKRMHK